MSDPSDIHWVWAANPFFEDDWWDPSPVLDKTFVSSGEDPWIFAKYENGILYFKFSPPMTGRT